MKLYTVFGLGIVSLSFDVEKDDFKLLINRLSYDKLNKFIKIDQICRNRVINNFAGRVRSVNNQPSLAFSTHNTLLFCV